MQPIPSNRLISAVASFIQEPLMIASDSPNPPLLIDARSSDLIAA
jgi:hypothetical protein